MRIELYREKLTLLISLIFSLRSIRTQNTVNGTFAKLNQFDTASVELCNSYFNRSCAPLFTSLYTQSGSVFQANQSVTFGNSFKMTPYIGKFVQEINYYGSNNLPVLVNINLSSINLTNFEYIVSVNNNTNLTLLLSIHLTYMATNDKRIELQNIQLGGTGLSPQLFSNSYASVPRTFLFIMDIQFVGSIQLDIQNPTKTGFDIKFSSNYSNAKVGVALLVVNLEDNQIQLDSTIQQVNFTDNEYHTVNQDLYLNWNNMTLLKNILILGLNGLTFLSPIPTQYGALSNINSNQFQLQYFQTSINANISKSLTIIAVFLYELQCEQTQGGIVFYGQCLCLDTQYAAKELNLCINCHYSCQTCNGGSSGQCQICNITDLRQSNGTTTCTCGDGYFDQQNISRCQSCHYSCQTCNGGSSNQCQICNITDLRQSNGTTTCICRDGYFDQQNVSRCQSIQIKVCHYSCSTCNGTGSNDCTTTCTSQDLRSFNGTSCVCTDGYYDLQSIIQCQNCQSPCQTCKSIKQCLSCISGQNKTLVNGTCICLDGQYQDPTTNICKNCHDSCVVCNGSERNNCQSQCRSSDLRQLINQTCMCQGGHYDLYVVSQCRQCHYQCLTCDNESNCTSCDPNNYRQLNSTNQCQCQSNQIEVSQPTCQLCNKKCQNCNLTSCICDDNCQWIQDQIAPLTVYLNNSYQQIQKPSSLTKSVIDGVVPFGCFGLFLKSPQFIFQLSFLNYKQPELVYQFQRILSIPLFLPYLSDDQDTPNKTYLNQFFVWDVTQETYQVEVNDRYRLLGLSPLTIYSNLSQYLYLTFFVLCCLLGRLFKSKAGYGLSRNIILKLIEGSFSYLVTSQLICIKELADKKFNTNKEFILSSFFSILLLVSYIIYNFHMIRLMKKYQIQRQSFLVCNIQKDFDDQKRLEYPVFFTFVKFDSFESSIYNILTQFKKILILAVLVFLNQYIIVQLQIIISLTIYHIIFLYLYDPHLHRIIHYTDVFQQVSFLLLSFSLAFDYQQSQTIPSGSRSGVTYIMLAFLVLLIDFVKYIAKWAYFIMNCQRKRKEKKIKDKQEKEDALIRPQDKKLSNQSQELGACDLYKINIKQIEKV